MLDNLYLKGIIYDVEIYRNLLLIGFFSLRMKRYRTYIWYGCNDQRRDMIKVVKNRILIGFNNWQFDDAVMCKIIETIDSDITLEELWEFTQTLIRGERNPYRYSKKIFTSYDLLELIRAGYSVISLKNLAVNLKWNKIQDLPIPFDSYIEEDKIDEISDYNINDLNITNELLTFCKPSLEMRELLSGNYNLDLYSLSDSGIGKELFNVLYVDKIRKKNKNINVNKIKYDRTHRKEILFKDVIFPSIQFKTPELQNYLEELKKIHLVEQDPEDVFGSLNSEDE